MIKSCESSDLPKKNMISASNDSAAIGWINLSDLKAAMSSKNKSDNYINLGSSLYFSSLW